MKTSGLRRLRLAGQDAPEHIQRDHSDLRLVTAGQYNGLPEQAHLSGELGEIRSRLCDAQVPEFGHVHALRIQESFLVQRDGLYNSPVSKTPHHGTATAHRS